MCSMQYWYHFGFLLYGTYLRHLEPCTHVPRNWLKDGLEVITRAPNIQLQCYTWVLRTMNIVSNICIGFSCSQVLFYHLILPTTICFGILIFIHIFLIESKTLKVYRVYASPYSQWARLQTQVFSSTSSKSSLPSLSHWTELAEILSLLWLQGCILINPKHKCCLGLRLGKRA